MYKKFIVALGFFAGANVALGADSFAPWFSMKFVTPTSFDESDSLPPVLYANFSRVCNQRVVKVVREDRVIDSKVIVNVGILVEQDDRIDCAGVYDDRSEAGLLFSGREYEVKPIEK